MDERAVRVDGAWHRVRIASSTAIEVRRACDVVTRIGAEPANPEALDEWFRCCSANCVRLLDYRFALLEAKQPRPRRAAMRDPADVIRYALRERFGTILAVREADAILAALRAEYGTRTHMQGAHDLGPIIPVPAAEEGEA